MAVKRRVLLGALSVLAAGAIVGGYLYTQGMGNRPPFRTVSVTRGPLSAAVSSTGTLNAVVTVLVGSQISGQIKELYADFNSQVRKGQVIARIDPEIFEARVTQAKAQVEAALAAVLNQRAALERARADLENARAALAGARAQTAKAQVAVLDARRDLGRKRDLRDKELIAQADLDAAQAAHDSAVAQHEAARAQEQAQGSSVRAAEAQLKVAEAQVQSALAQVGQQEAALRQAQVDLDRTIIRAPVDGVVVSRNVDVGQTVAASLQAPTLFTIAQDLSKMQVDTNVDEADVGRISIGLGTTFTVDAFPGRSFSGEVIQIRKAPQVVQNVVTYNVVVSADNPDLRLLPGMTANVRIVTDRRDNVLRVPNAALRFRPPGVDTERAPRGDGAAPAAAAGPPGGGPGLEGIRERLVKGLGLSAEQQQQLDTILQESRQKILALQGQALPEGDRRAQVQRIREASRERIRSMLTPEQRASYDRLAGEGGSGRGTTQGRAWVIGPDGKPQAVPLQLGITDGALTEVLGGGLKEQQEVIVGSGTAERPPGQPGGPRLRF